MKGRESGMPDADWWDSFFDPPSLLDLMEVTAANGPIVDFGAGYGTFSLPLAMRVDWPVHAFDIEPDLVEALRQEALSRGHGHLDARARDLVEDGTGLPESSVAHAMLWNILHMEDPLGLLAEARRILRPGGTVSVLHWRSDIPTPRGPSLAIRPLPDQVARWLAEAGFTDIAHVAPGPAAPWHYGILARKPED